MIQDTCGAESCVGIKSESKQCNIGCPYGGKPSIGRCACSGYSGTCCEKGYFIMIWLYAFNVLRNNLFCKMHHIIAIYYLTFTFTDVNECLMKPCKNKGVCTNTKGSFKCTCTADFTGDTCQKRQFIFLDNYNNI